jgi:hypothetical protein
MIGDLGCKLNFLVIFFLFQALWFSQTLLMANTEVNLKFNGSKKLACFILQMKRIEDVELHRRPQRATFRFYDTFVEE